MSVSFPDVISSVEMFVEPAWRLLFTKALKEAQYLEGKHKDCIIKVQTGASLQGQHCKESFRLTCSR